MTEKVLTGIAACLLGVAGCAGPSGDAAAPREVRVAAAADLKFAFDEVAATFQARHPGIAIKVTYGSSGNFYTQLANEAPFDLFLSADLDYPRKLVEQG